MTGLPPASGSPFVPGNTPDLSGGLPRQEMDQSAYWAFPSQLQAPLMNAHLQLQMATQRACQGQAESLYSSASTLSGLSSLGTRSGFGSIDLQRPGILPQPEVPWPGVPVSALPVNPSYQNPPMAMADWQGVARRNAAIDDGGIMSQQLAVPASLLKASRSQIDAQVVAMERLRRELTRLQTELERAEREVNRQKSLRETERLEFSDAKDRLKNSWANDREDFARVKALLKTKNAEHHAQSGRLSQNLKECEACNRSLRELASRNGIAIPIELESAQMRRFAFRGLSRKSGSSDVSNNNTSAVPATTGFERRSFDILMNSTAQVAHKCQSLPDRLGSQLRLSPAGDILLDQSSLDPTVPANAKP